MVRARGIFRGPCVRRTHRTVILITHAMCVALCSACLSVGYDCASDYWVPYAMGMAIYLYQISREMQRPIKQRRERRRGPV